jgi:hypothetical protein
VHYLHRRLLSYVSFELSRPHAVGMTRNTHQIQCLVDPPGSVCHLEMRTDALVQLGCISLDPTKEGRVIHRDATIGEHALEIAIADGELQIPADRSQNDLRRELSTLERVLASLLHRQPLFTPSLHTWGRRSLKAATEPVRRGLCRARSPAIQDIPALPDRNASAAPVPPDR